MRSNYLIKIESEGQKVESMIPLYCSLRQANKVFISLSFALATNKENYKKLSLSVSSRAGETLLNVAHFHGDKS